MMANTETQTSAPTGQSPRWERIALASGIAFMVAQVGALIVFSTTLLPRMPAIDAPVAERAAFFAEHGDLLILNNYLLVLPVPFFLVFLGGFYSFLRRNEGSAGALAAIAFAAGITMAMVWPLGIVITNVGVEIARGGGDAATVSALDAMAPYTLALSALPKAVMLAASSILILHTRIAQRWIAWAGFLLAGVTLAGSGTLMVGDLFPLLGLASLLFYVWIGAVTISLLRGTRSMAVGSSQIRTVQA
jgi:hypothetical protein